MTYEKRKTLWCRNCNEMTTHELIGTKEIPAECNPPRFLRKPAKTFPVYACFFCRCQRGDENGTAFGRGFEQVCRRKDSI